MVVRGWIGVVAVVLLGVGACGGSDTAGLQSRAPSESSPPPTMSSTNPRPTVTTTVTVSSTAPSPTSMSAPSVSSVPSTSQAAAPDPVAFLECPPPQAVVFAGQDGSTVIGVECYEENSWLLVESALPDGTPLDGIRHVRQTAPGTFEAAFGHSAPLTAAELRDKGAPESVVALLAVDLQPGNDENAEAPGDLSAFVGTWQQRYFILVINADGTGRIELASGADSWYEYEISVRAVDGTHAVATRGATISVQNFSEDAPATIDLEYQEGVVVASSPSVSFGPGPWSLI